MYTLDRPFLVPRLLYIVECLQMEYLCTLCLGPTAVTGASGELRAHIAAAAQQRKQQGLHPELPFVVVRVLYIGGYVYVSRVSHGSLC